MTTADALEGAEQKEAKRQYYYINQRKTLEGANHNVELVDKDACIQMGY